VLVTGGAGFIGSHLVERLRSAGHDVRVLDDLSSGRHGDLLERLGVELLVGDAADAAAADEAVRGCDAVCHLAAVASVAESIERPLRTLRANLFGTVTVLEAAAAAGVGRFVYASSAAVYGDARDLPLREDARPLPLSPYAADKLAGEHYLGHYHRSGLLRGHAFRFFNVYGPRQDPRSPYSGVISVFLDRAAAGLPLVVDGDGLQTRDFVYVSDVVDVLARALAGAGDDEGDLPVTNVGRGVSVSVLELAEAVGEALGTRPDVEFGPPRAGDVRHSRADVTLLTRRFGSPPATSLAEGLRATARVAARLSS
jgi:UDP-glucose 4-epimerase